LTSVAGDRQHDVLRASGEGAAIAGIAGLLFPSEGTVRSYLSSSAVGRTGVRRVQIARCLEAEASESGCEAWR